MPLTTLRNVAEWDQYRHEMAARYGLEAAVVRFGAGPQAYPCCVASVRKDVETVASAYFYVADAIRLLQEAGAPLPKPEPPPAPATALDPESIKENARMVSANLLAIVHFLVETGICRTEQYEEVLNAKLAEVDQNERAALDAIRPGPPADAVE